jgi:hypothetical protein
MYVKSVFLNNDLKEEVYIHQSLGFTILCKEGKMLRLRKHPLWLAAGTESVE